MADVAFIAGRRPAAASRCTSEPRWFRVALTAGVLVLLAVLLFAPLAVVFAEALREGVGAALATLGEPATRCSAIRLTLLVAAIAVPLNAVFGIAAAWAIAKFDFRGKAFLITLIDLPFSVSPVVAGLCFVLLFGANGAVRRLAGRARDQGRLRGARASCSRRCSSPSPSSPAS